MRGVEFHRKLVERFNFHNFDLIMDNYVSRSGLDPRMRTFSKEHQITSVLFAAMNGDLSTSMILTTDLTHLIRSRTKD